METHPDCTMAYGDGANAGGRSATSGSTDSNLPSDLSNLKITPPNESGLGSSTPMDTSIPLGVNQACDYPTNPALSSTEQLISQHGATSTSKELQDEPTDIAKLEETAKVSYTSFQQAFTFQCSHGYKSEPIMSHANIRNGHHMIIKSMEPNPQMDVNNSMFQRMTGLIEKVVKFCKGVPGFKSLSLNDQMLILKAATFEIVALQTASVVDLNEKMLTFLGDPHVVVPFHMLSLTPFGSMLEELKHVGGKLKSLEIRPIELSLLCGVVLLSPGTVY